jgi:hypothetical protein
MISKVIINTQSLKITEIRFNLTLMKNREEFAQQSCLLRSWLEAAPFKPYRGWCIRAFQEANGWSWDIIEPECRGGGLFESAKLYPCKSKALLEARKLIIRNTVSFEVTQVLQSFYADRLIDFDEVRALISSIQESQALQLK